MDDALKEARRSLSRSLRPCVLAGAGLSAESGVPTFRGEDGLWRKFRPEELASPAAFSADPKLVWEWYDWRRQKIAACRPNPGHEALAALEKSKPGAWLITQNVDGLSRRAGSKKILEIHGNIWRMRCTRCARYVDDRTAPLPELPPRCKDCGFPLRPGVVWFGESLPKGTFAKAVEAAREADVFLVVGTAGTVEPAASLARLAKESGAYLIEINPEDSALTPWCDAAFRAPAGEILPRLVSSDG